MSPKEELALMDRDIRRNAAQARTVLADPRWAKVAAIMDGVANLPEYTGEGLMDLLERVRAELPTATRGPDWHSANRVVKAVLDIWTAHSLGLA